METFIGFVQLHAVLLISMGVITVIGAAMIRTQRRLVKEGKEKARRGE